MTPSAATARRMRAIGYLRERQITLTYDLASGALHAGTAQAARTITLTAS